MKLEASINDQGILITPFPKSLWSKKVLISIESIPDKADTLFDIFAEADCLDIPRRTHAEINEKP